MTQELGWRSKIHSLGLKENVKTVLINSQIKFRQNACHLFQTNHTWTWNISVTRTRWNCVSGCWSTPDYVNNARHQIQLHHTELYCHELCKLRSITHKQHEPRNIRLCTLEDNTHTLNWIRNVQIWQCSKRVTHLKLRWIPWNYSNSTWLQYIRCMMTAEWYAICTSNCGTCRCVCE